jgi:hypothetical protein
MAVQDIIREEGEPPSITVILAVVYFGPDPPDVGSGLLSMTVHNENWFGPFFEAFEHDRPMTVEFS